MYKPTRWYSKRVCNKFQKRNVKGNKKFKLNSFGKLDLPTCGKSVDVMQYNFLR